MIRNDLSHKISRAVASLVAEGRLPDIDWGEVEILDTKQPEHGDYACNLAMTASKKAGMNPRQIAEAIAACLELDDSLETTEVAGPGFLNLRLKPEAVASYIPHILEGGIRFGQTQPGPDSPSINVEFVSVNPNGPITIGSGRGAAFGSALCNVLEASGTAVHREYYINDGVNSEQMRQFALSVRALYLGEPLPEKAYRGDYVQDVADRLKAIPGFDSNLDAAGWQRASQEIMLIKQREDLEAFGVTFNTWFSEQSLHDDGSVQRCLDQLIARGVADEDPHRVKIKFARKGGWEEVERETQTTAADDGPNEEASEDAGEGTTVWLRSTKFGDDMDRVLRRRDGRLTYISSDVAYHLDKFSRGTPDGTRSADRLMTVLGPDHHGYIGRLRAVVAAVRMPAFDLNAPGEPLSEMEAQVYRTPAERDACQAATQDAAEKLNVQIFQLVRFVKDGQPAPMRKRDGNIYALIDLIREIGAASGAATEEEQLRIGRDVARYFYLMRSHDTTMDFDLDLASRQSDENPVFYVQYAHARICAVLRRAEEEGFAASTENLHLLTHARESALIKKALDLPWEIERCRADYGVHRLTGYAQELARAYHHFYDACRVIQPDQPELTGARIALCTAARDTLRSVLGLLGISAPERMDRA